jgi:hypothetical protein
MTQEADANSSGEVGPRQRLPELITGEKNRYLLMIGPKAQSPSLRSGSWAWQGQFQGQN